MTKIIYDRYENGVHVLHEISFDEDQSSPSVTNEDNLVGKQEKVTEREALKMAIDFIDEITNAAGKYPYVNETSLIADSYAMASKLKEALEQPAQEPVYIVKQNGNCTMQLKSKDWVGLSLPDIEALYKQSDSISLYAFTQDVRAIEAKLKEKNHDTHQR